MPSVSVCIPVYNGARFIGDAITSVLAQTFDDFEIVIVDNASSDDTVTVVEAFIDSRIRLVRNSTNLGAEANWNRAVDLARGEFVKLLCADDALNPDCLAMQVVPMVEHREAVLVASRRDVVDENKNVLVPSRGLGNLSGLVDGRTAIRAAVRAGTNIFGEPACVLMRREQMQRCGPFSARQPYMIDLDYWCRMLQLGSLYAQGSTVALFRVALDSWSVGLARRQGAQAAAFFRDLRRLDPETVRAVDVVVGSTRARALAGVRATGYRVLASKPALLLGSRS